MTVLLTEVQTAAKMIKIAREQIDAFNSGDWERVRAGLTSDSRMDELATERKVEGPEKIVELFTGWKQAFPDAADGRPLTWRLLDRQAGLPQRPSRSSSERIALSNPNDPDGPFRLDSPIVPARGLIGSTPMRGIKPPVRGAHARAVPRCAPA